MVLLSFIPSLTRSRCTDAKVVRLGWHLQGRVAKPFRAESSSNGFERIQSENLAAVCHALKSIRQRKQATDGKSEETKRKGRLTDEAWF